MGSTQKNATWKNYFKIDKSKMKITFLLLAALIIIVNARNLRKKDDPSLQGSDDEGDHKRERREARKERDGIIPGSDDEGDHKRERREARNERDGIIPEQERDDISTEERKRRD